MSLRQLAMASGLMAALALTGCAMPRHSNTMVFGTTTRVALDVSQEPTGAMGVTLVSVRRTHLVPRH